MLDELMFMFVIYAANCGKFDIREGRRCKDTSFRDDNKRRKFM